MLTDEQLHAITARALGRIDDAALTAELRREFPGLIFTVCSDDDVIGVDPVVERGDFNVYLVSGSEHCLGLTRDMASAAGVVLAAKFDDL